MRNKDIIIHDFTDILFLKTLNVIPRVPWGESLKIVWKFDLFKKRKMLLEFLSRLSLDHFNNKAVFNEFEQQKLV